MTKQQKKRLSVAIASICLFIGGGPLALHAENAGISRSEGVTGKDNSQWPATEQNGQANQPLILKESPSEYKLRDYRFGKVVGLANDDSNPGSIDLDKMMQQTLNTSQYFPNLIETSTEMKKVSGMLR